MVLHFQKKPVIQETRSDQHQNWYVIAGEGNEAVGIIGWINTGGGGSRRPVAVVVVVDDFNKIQLILIGSFLRRTKSNQHQNSHSSGGWYKEAVVVLAFG